MVVVERNYDIAYVEEDRISGIWENGDGMAHYSVRGEEVSRAKYKAWLDEQDDETRQLMAPPFYAVCN